MLIVIIINIIIGIVFFFFFFRYIFFIFSPTNNMNNFCFLFNTIIGEIMDIKSVMSKCIVVCSSDDSIYCVSNIMKDYDIGFVPVVDYKKVVGVITDRDIVVKVISNDDYGPVSNYMTKSVVSVSVDDSVLKVFSIMRENKIKRVLVHDNKKVVGVLSISDLFNYSGDELMDTIKCIWAIDNNDDNYNVSIDDFYL